MAEKVLMLALSPTMETGTIVKWTVKEGDSVGAGDILCEVETDKAVMDYEGVQEGIMLKIVLPEGGEAKVGDTIAIIGETGEDVSALLTEDAAASDDKAPAPTELPVEVLLERSVAPAAQADTGKGGGKVKSSPLARKLAKEAGLELAVIPGSGPAGRIVQRDIETALKNRAAVAAELVVSKAAPSVVPNLRDEVVPVSQRRKIIAKRLAESMYSAPHYYLKVTVNMAEILEARKALNNRLKEKVSMNAFLMKFVAEALKKYPIVNSTWAGDTIVKHGSVDVGLAVAQADGLITPLVRDCVNKGIKEIDADLKELITKAQNNRLEPDEYTGATFTISSLGSFGIQEFTAIINPPGSAILAVGEIRKEAVVGEDNELHIQPNMIVTLSCDHRVIDGAVGAAFLTELKGMLEHPIRTLY
ncbi:MAG: 2-oxo acid dehydrogenase subunit E2 [bacterium]|nr:2-oxo acid dehydrogenase subunit E2 [bacterium]